MDDIISNRMFKKHENYVYRLVRKRRNDVVKQQFQTNHPQLLNDAPYRNLMVDEGDAQGLLIYHLSIDTDDQNNLRCKRRYT